MLFVPRTQAFSKSSTIVRQPLKGLSWPDINGMFFGDSQGMISLSVDNAIGGQRIAAHTEPSSRRHESAAALHGRLALIAPPILHDRNVTFH
jgi:hypothetical protein